MAPPRSAPTLWLCNYKALPGHHQKAAEYFGYPHSPDVIELLMELVVFLQAFNYLLAFSRHWEGTLAAVMLLYLFFPDQFFVPEVSRDATVEHSWAAPRTGAVGVAGC